MHIINMALFVMLLLASGCQKVSIAPELSRLQNSATELTGEEIAYYQSLSDPIDEQIGQQIDAGISRQQAIGIALKNNPELQVLFETIGIAKSDLTQAGLYTNPDIHGFFWPPLKGSRVELETGAFFNVAELWQVPLRKNVQKDVLESVTLVILGSILDIMEKTRMAYDKVLTSQRQLEIAQDIVDQTVDLKNSIEYRQEFGLSNDLDTYFAQVAVGNAQRTVIRLHNKLSQAYIHIKKILGLRPTADPIRLTEQLDDQVELIMKGLPMLEQLQEWALANRPEILKAGIKIKQYEDAVSYERSRRLQTLNAGVSFKQDFSGDRGVGPSLELSLPIFDANSAQISRAKYLLVHAKKDLVAMRISIQKEVESYYTQLINRHKEIMLYKETLLPSATKAFDFTEAYEQQMQVTMVTLLQTKTMLYQTKQQFSKTYYEALTAFSHLERAVGKRI